MGSQLVTAITPGIIVAECARHGVSQEKLLLHAGVAADSLPAAAGHVPLDKMHNLWESAIQLTHDGMFALHAAEKLPFGTYRVLDYLMAASATPGDALARSTRCFPLMNNTFRLSLGRYRDLAYLELHNPGDPKYMPRPYIEYIFVNYLVRIRFVTQMHWKLVELHVTYGKPEVSTEYERIFGGRVLFQQAVNRMVLSRGLMEMPHPSADPELCELLEDHARQKMKDPAFGNDWMANIHQALAYNLEAGDVTLVSLARQLGKSSRSLQREIRAHGLSFRELLDCVRRERAFVLLRKQTLPIHEVASGLLFSDPSSFSHAFQRWTGQSPRQYRKKLN